MTHLLLQLSLKITGGVFYNYGRLVWYYENLMWNVLYLYKGDLVLNIYDGDPMTYVTETYWCIVSMHL